MTTLRDLVADRGVLLVDGAMGTELFSRGLPSGESPERWNIDEPERVQSVHQAYVEAGSDIFLTNSFGGTHFRLALHDLHHQVVEINTAAARIARDVADASERVVLVAGSMGPTGELLEPMGTMTPETCASAFAEQAEGLAAGGADLLWIETMSSSDELAAAVTGTRRSTDLPIIATMSFDTAGRTMMGVTGRQAAVLAVELGIEGIGANCGNNLADTEAAVTEMLSAAPDLVVVSKGNAGIPEWRGADLYYSGSPALMAAYADRARQLGVALIGACCGSTPDHIAHMRRVLDGVEPVPDISIEAAPERTAGTRRRSGRSRRSA
ncbi:MAG: betaine--homocysteine S-methyltransferase [Acidimicrobiales bacterium]